MRERKVQHGFEIHQQNIKGKVYNSTITLARKPIRFEEICAGVECREQLFTKEKEKKGYGRKDKLCFFRYIYDILAINCSDFPDHAKLR
ncbi:unnamed protein product [Gongylonema pulchrum]|uniref:Uncharacterized protein n=1 Tax=Gongylonema pulchrum TaxID=637853 RepID=A0A183D1W3_9BILA|nr:unnamed protein product [Gongylonema pulchrum]